MPTFLPRNYFRDTATVYTGDDFSTVAKASLACRLEDVDMRNAATGFERADLAARQELFSHPDYEIPKYSQLSIVSSGQTKRWNPEPSSIKPVKHHNGTVVMWRCDVVEAGT